MTSASGNLNAELGVYKRKLTIFKRAVVILAAVLSALCIFLAYTFVAGLTSAEDSAISLSDGGGIEIIDYRGRMVLVVPEGAELISWRPPGLSNLARYGDRLYRLRAAEDQ